MKIFAEVPPGLSKAMDRVVFAMKREVPFRAVEFVDREEAADVVILHVIGYPETVDAVVRIQERGQQYVIVQYCMRSTQRPRTEDWEHIWRGARLVWSYYDLDELISEDGNDFSFDFYCAPLGTDPIFCHAVPQEVKMWTMISSGYVAESEGVEEVHAAVRRVNGRHFHLGPKDACPGADAHGVGISDYLLRDLYTRTYFVAGLRRAEGFEMPAAEGLVCGARPIMFDAPHYRQWFNEFAEFVPEGTKQEVTDAIVTIFENGFRPVSEDERMAAIAKFNWKTIIPEFWEGVL